ncbi:MAG: DNA polymerase III subunit delta [Sporomusaceae bacterium]|nr:DNA polymerase III subunit delta [Sporomusaceae bacterium]
MTVGVLQKELEQGKIYSLYLLHGDEVYLLDKLQKTLVNGLVPPNEQEMNLTVFDQDPSLEELAGMVSAISFFGGRNVILIRNTRFFSAGKKADGEGTAKKDEAFLKLLKQVPPETTVIFAAYDKVDKRRKAYKLIGEAGVVYEAVPLKGQELFHWLQAEIRQRGKKIEAAALEAILAAVSLMPHASLSFLDQEITKLLLFIGKKSMITLQDVELLLANVPEMSVFAMTEAMSRKDVAQALAVLADQIESGQPRLKLLGLLARHTRQLYQTKALLEEGWGAKEVAKELKLPSFVADKLIRQSRSFSLTQLNKAMELLKEADEDLKFSRELISLEKIILFLCH